ncbi:MAG: serine hydrolase [Gemmatimonadota bacterium]|nr:serine hydrolase [Gemmatimonadota bacterium]
MLLFACALTAVACGDGPTGAPATAAIDLVEPWVRASPAVLAIDEGALEAAGRQAERIERLRALVVIRHGRLAYERYFHGWDAETLADVRSVTKSVVSTLVGLAVRDGHIESIDQPITDYLRAPRFPVRPEHEAITIRHLLTMTGGFEWSEATVDLYNEWVLSPDQVANILDRALVTTPGSTFLYNTGAVHLLGVLLEEATGMDLETYAQQTLFRPIGISRAVWEPGTGGFVNGGAGLDLAPRDMARFGQLALQNGWSGEHAVVPEAWLAEATAPWFSWTSPAGPIEHVTYGYLWWVDRDHDAFFAWGHGGQFVYVVPRLDLVVVTATEYRGAAQDIGIAALHALVLDLIVHGIVGAMR